MFIFFKFFTGMLKPGKLLRIIAIVLVLAVVGFGLWRWLGPKPVFATETTLSVLFGQVEISKDGGSTWQPGKDGDRLKVEYWIKTGANSYALITFWEGSTVEIEPDSTVKIEEMSSVAGTTKVTLWQEVGKTWTRVEKLADPASQHQINTPSGVAVVRGSLIETAVERVIEEEIEKKRTIVKAFKGAVKVIAQGIEVLVTPGKESSIELGQPPAPPTPIPPPASKLNISISSTSPAWLQVIDPIGRSAGIVPPGIAVNQIPRSVSGGALDKEQFVEISEPIGGEYQLVFYAQRDGILEENPLEVTMEGSSQGQVVFTETREGAVAKDKVYRLLLQLTVEDKAITQVGIGEIELHPEQKVAGEVVRMVEATKKLELPVADFIADPIQAVVGEAIQFSDLSSGAPMAWLWDFGDGTSSTEQSPSHIYVAVGTYTVSLTITSPGGSNAVSKPGYASISASLDANFTALVTSGSAPLEVRFIDLSTGRPSEWDWDFGDGTTSTQQNPTHTYTAGVYTVTLKVIYPTGDEYTDIKGNYIKVEE